ncbi:MAG: RNA polymerase sporulation sigma factor SigF [Caldicoprobacterales bacterium]|jgi:RNA polymerase sporulation-specific sigma factor|nr:RNA polymerase sporulation sigma factor SigF [Clostridia bacterium]MDI9511757.1 RNA polymerase sporulation sigma factor SigF [Bacillota bacterium]NLH59242.1 RNA polymerase sporulation sigma factor SigF [Clostridiales bacterium]
MDVVSASQEDRQLLSHDETLSLLEKAQQGDEKAKERLVEKNIALVKSLVKKFLNRGYEYEDLFQLGSIGLVKAIYNYNPSYNVRFSTYAVPMIIGEIKRFLRDDSMIKVSRSLKELVTKANAAKEYLKAELKREPTIQEIAENIESSPDEIIYAMEAVRAPTSIYDVIYEDDDNPILLIDKVSEEYSQEDEAMVRLTLKDLLSKLEKRERTIIVMRYFQDKTQSEIAKLLDISQVQVSRIEKRILKKMREMI